MGECMICDRDFCDEMVCLRCHNAEVKRLRRERDEAKEDLDTICDQVSRVYMEVTGNRVSKPNTDASVVIGFFEEQLTDAVEAAEKRAEQAEAERDEAMAAAKALDGDRDSLNDKLADALRDKELAQAEAERLSWWLQRVPSFFVEAPSRAIAGELKGNADTLESAPAQAVRTRNTSKQASHALICCSKRTHPRRDRQLDCHAI